jgi:hypothetical protein
LRNVFRIRLVLVEGVSILLHSRSRLHGFSPNRAANEFWLLTYTLCFGNLADKFISHSQNMKTNYGAIYWENVTGFDAETIEIDGSLT